MSTGIVSVSLRARCPGCGKGALYQGLLNVRTMCDICGLDLKKHEQGDGPAVFSILIVGFVVTALAGIIEFKYEPPLWLHAALWLPLIVVLSLWSLRVSKAAIIAVHFRYRGDDRGM